ncbi:MAG: nitroreductase/quinone reductase family protein [Dermatophilaceae bacterium]
MRGSGAQGGLSSLLPQLSRWMYRGGRPNWLARVMNRLGAIQYSAGLFTLGRGVTLEVRGRKSGKVVAFPLVLVDYEGGRYLVSMLGADVNWVHNVRAANGHAVLRQGTAGDVVLVEVDPAQRAPILRRYLALAPGARPHIPVSRDAPLAELEKIADHYPVFRVTQRE